MAPIDPQLLVTKGLLPENLPPVFTTASVWTALAPKHLAYVVTPKATGELCLYNSSKRGGQRRVFAIPHPLFVKEQGLFLRKHWSQIEALFDTAVGSVSRPQVDAAGPRHVRITSHRDLPKIRLQTLSRFKFCLVTDVSRFFYSIYTHALPWALNGKAAAKTDNDKNSATVFGNRLDFIIRQAQAKQTIGIPVGPDSSKIAAEIIMSAVDQSFIKRSGQSAPVYVRHVDDYWIGGHTYEECEKHLANLRAALRDYELDINESKTRIISTSYVFGETWPSEFDKAIEVDFGFLMDEHSGISTLAHVVDRATKENDDGIIRHVIRIFDKKKLWDTNWNILEHFLAQCSVQFPHSFDYVARVIAWRARVGQSINVPMWREIAELTTKQHSALGRDSETCWGIWLLKELGAKLPKSLTDLMVTNSGGLGLAFLAHFPKHKMSSDRTLLAKLRQVVVGDPYAGPFWPLSLELSHLGAGDANWDTAATLQALRALHQAKVSLIDWDAAPRVFATPPTSDGGEPPDYAIEDFGADYGDEDSGQDEGPDGADTTSSDLDTHV